ncbi:hypothetical protein [Desulfitobacterium sp.]|uniref:hypothetical protein n=1 Tax=Desulfitobacterium sp. TaxID=49981 RepID=UPI002BF17341|nr:hypothetical protein [Desulfitobacterium sp.]HVJ49721.1 hypothetical protein [Desulfitobacterium sp.]
MEIDGQKQLAIDLLIQGEKKTDIARQIGIQRTLLYDWMKHPEFKDRMEAQMFALDEPFYGYADPVSGAPSRNGGRFKVERVKE